MMGRTWDYKVKLADVETSINDNGFEEEKIVYKEEIFANKLNVYSSEFWTAKQNLIKLEHVFEIHDFEYAGEKVVNFDDVDYGVERTYLNKDGFLELVLSKWGDAHGS